MLQARQDHIGDFAIDSDTSRNSKLLQVWNERSIEFWMESREKCVTNEGDGYIKVLQGPDLWHSEDGDEIRLGNTYIP